MTGWEEVNVQLNDLLKAENLPSQKSEDYRYTSLKQVEVDRAAQNLSTLSSPPESYLQRDEGEALLLWQQAGSSTLHGMQPLPGLQIDQDSSRQPLSASLQGDPFARLSAERAGNRLCVHISRDFRGGVIRLLNYFSPEAHTFLVQTQVILEPGAQATFIEEWVGPGASSPAPFCSVLTQVICGHESRLSYQLVQNFGAEVQLFHRLSVHGQKDAVFEGTSVFVGGVKCQMRNEMECLASGAQINMLGAARADHRQHFDFWACARHNVADTSSKTEYLTVMADSARSVFNGNIVIGPQGLRTDARQQNRNLLLSKGAVANTIPKLEIATDDVKCSHGATVVAVDEDQIYYLQSRGLSRRDSQLMIINGFTDPVTRRLQGSQLRKRVEQAIEAKHALEEGAS